MTPGGRRRGTGRATALRCPCPPAEVTKVDAKCPGCATVLQGGQVNGHREYLCPSCGGALLTIPVLRQLVGAEAQQIWTEDADPEGGDHACPFCTRPMEAKGAPVGHAAVCRPCEAVWLDQDLYRSLTVTATTTPQPTLASQTLLCPNCGAPIPDSSAECCKYCGASLHPTQNVVVVMPPPPAPEYRGLGTGLLGTLLGGISEL